MDGIQKTSSCGLLCSISYCGIDQIPQKGIESRYGRLPEKESIAGWQVPSGNRDNRSEYGFGPYTHVGIDTAKVFGESGRPDD